jgi:imidazolonepropionase-like amidohydrolase
MKARGTYLEPTLWVFTHPEVPPVVASWGAQVAARAHAMGIPILAGTDGFVERDTLAPPVIHRELQRLVEAGLSPAAALATATTVPARAMGRARTHGLVAAGRVADLVLLDANPLEDIRHTTRIRAVVLRGQVLPR